MKSMQLCSPQDALPGRAESMLRPTKHLVLGTAYDEAPPAGSMQILLGMGCFWGAERLFWRQTGVWRTAVGYAGGHTPNPSYREVCSGQTAHTEVVEVIFDPKAISLHDLLRVFWEHHDPTQGMRQGNDQGTQYRSAIYTQDEPALELALDSKARYAAALEVQGLPSITTEIQKGHPFYYAEIEHQQYLHKHPQGYCGLAGTGVLCPAPY